MLTVRVSCVIHFNTHTVKYVMHKTECETSLNKLHVWFKDQIQETFTCVEMKAIKAWHERQFR